MKKQFKVILEFKDAGDMDAKSVEDELKECLELILNDAQGRILGVTEILEKGGIN